jgi:hypothetical protein
MATIKKAQYGDRITGRQKKRLGRLLAKNPEKAKEVGERMKERATRRKRGGDFYNSLELKLDYPAFKAKTLEEARKEKEEKEVKKARNGGSLSGLKGSSKRVGPVDSTGAWTKVQKKTLAGAKGKATLKKDKQLGATKMKSSSKAKAKKKK